MAFVKKFLFDLFFRTEPVFLAVLFLPSALSASALFSLRLRPGPGLEKMAVFLIYADALIAGLACLVFGFMGAAFSRGEGSRATPPPLPPGVVALLAGGCLILILCCAAFVLRRFSPSDPGRWLFLPAGATFLASLAGVIALAMANYKP